MCTACQGAQKLKMATDAVTLYSAFFPRALHSETPEHRYDNANSKTLSVMFIRYFL